MDFSERAKVIALARMLGASGTDQEIYDRFWTEYQKIMSAPVETNDVPSAEVIQWPSPR